jgi:hypothetical protein
MPCFRSAPRGMSPCWLPETMPIQTFKVICDCGKSFNPRETKAKFSEDLKLGREN